MVEETPLQTVAGVALGATEGAVLTVTTTVLVAVQPELVTVTV